MSVKYHIRRPIVGADLERIYEAICDAYEMAPDMEEQQQILKWRTCIQGMGLKYDIPGRGRVIIVHRAAQLHITTQITPAVIESNPEKRLTDSLDAYFWKDGTR